MGEAKWRHDTNQQGTRVGAHHVVIIEWLPADERQTGTDLANLIRPWNKCGVVHRPCKCAAEVLASLYDTLEDLKTTGQVPIVHIEAHGIAPADDEEDGLSGPDGKGGTEYLYWKQLAPLLSEINLHARFRALLVGAACRGINALASIEITSRHAPFTALIGFDGKVQVRGLFECLSALYWQLLNGSHGNLPQAVEVANRELSASAGEELKLTTCRSFFLAAVVGYLKSDLEPAYRAQENERLRLLMLGQGKSLSVSDVDRKFRQAMRQRLREIVKIYFAYDALPENRKRFPVNVGRIIHEQEQFHAQAKPGTSPRAGVS
jgi:hypothetical protein